VNVSPFAVCDGQTKKPLEDENGHRLGLGRPALCRLAPTTGDATEATVLRLDGDISARRVEMSGTPDVAGAVELSEHPTAINAAAQRANPERREGGMSSS
jgi:hypothetical protein